MPLRLMPTRHSPFYSPLLAVHAAGFLRHEGIESTLRLPAEGESTAAVLRRGEVDVIQSAVSAAWTAIEKGVTDFPTHIAQIMGSSSSAARRIRISRGKNWRAKP
jgi:NitT/TauT family transport system substrate-binding protein